MEWTNRESEPLLPAWSNVCECAMHCLVDFEMIDLGGGECMAQIHEEKQKESRPPCLVKGMRCALFVILDEQEPPALRLGEWFVYVYVCVWALLSVCGVGGGCVSVYVHGCVVETEGAHWWAHLGLLSFFFLFSYIFVSLDFHSVEQGLQMRLHVAEDVLEDDVAGGVCR